MSATRNMEDENIKTETAEMAETNAIVEIPANFEYEDLIKIWNKAQAARSVQIFAAETQDLLEWFRHAAKDATNC